MSTNLGFKIGTVLLGSAARKHSTSMLPYFNQRFLGTLADGDAESNHCSVDGIHISSSELAKIEEEFKVKVTNNLLIHVAVHEIIHYDLRHPWQLQFLHKYFKNRYKDNQAEVAARMTIYRTLCEWLTNYHTFKAIKPLGLSTTEKKAIKEVATCYENSKDEIKKTVGKAWLETSPERVVINMPEKDTQDLAEQIQQQMEALEGLAGAIQQMMDNSAEDGTEGEGGKGIAGSVGTPSPNGIPTDEELDNGTMPEGKRLQHESDIQITSDQSGVKEQGGHISSATEMLLSMSKVTIDPTQIFTDYLERVAGNNQETWDSPNKKFYPMGLYLPSTIDYGVESIGVMVDTSGSMSKEELKVALGVGYECGLAIPFQRMEVISVDTEIRGREEIYSVAELEDSIKLSGGGGTEFSKAFDILKEEPVSILIVITDGYVNITKQDDPSIPMCWVLTDERRYKNFKPPFGVCVPGFDLEE